MHKKMAHYSYVKVVTYPWSRRPAAAAVIVEKSNRYSSGDASILSVLPRSEKIQGHMKTYLLLARSHGVKASIGTKKRDARMYQLCSEGGSLCYLHTWCKGKTMQLRGMHQSSDEGIGVCWKHGT